MHEEAIVDNDDIISKNQQCNDTEEISFKIINYNEINDNNKNYKNNKNIIDLINYKIIEKKLFYSIEISPLKNLQLDFNELIPSPLFTAITWSSDLNLKELYITNSPAFKLAKQIKSSTLILTHVTCYKMTEEKLNDILNIDVITNILALRGDFTEPNQLYQHAIDLINAINTINIYVKKPLTIAVAGYPNGHPEAVSFKADLEYLKEKINLNISNFIITQICFSSEQIINFIKACRSIGIQKTILPGIFVPHSYQSLIAMCKICKVRVPENDFFKYKSFKNDTDKFCKYSTECNIRLIDNLINNNFEKIIGIHFFTLNNFKQIKNIINKFNF